MMFSSTLQLKSTGITLRRPNTHHSILAVALRVRSFKSIAAGIVMARVMNPRILNVHAMPTFSIKKLRLMDSMPPPSPPPAKTNPLAKPLRFLKY